MFYQKSGQSFGEGITVIFLLDFRLVAFIFLCILKLLYLQEEFEQAVVN